MEILVVGLSVSGFLLASGVPMDNADITRFHFMEKDGGLQEVSHEGFKCLNG